jgi:hypothetical protein
MRSFYIALIALVFALGFFAGRASAPIIEQETDVAATSTNAVEHSNALPSVPVTISTEHLSDGQRRLLSTLGIDADTLVITPEMAACAESKIGTSRLEEITNGSTPSFTEGAHLLACYRQ